MEYSAQSHWIPLSDLMTGLMMVFLLIAAAFMLRVEQTTTLVVREYVDTKSELQMALQQEFSDDLKQWNAELLGDMTIRFKDPATLFATGSADLSPEFRTRLADFLPRYVELLTRDKFRDAIKDVRIEGHTSAFWSTAIDEQDAYIHNMELSQARTRSTLAWMLSLPQLQSWSLWLREHVTANGLSSSHPIPGADGGADSPVNQRVEFRIIANSDERMEEIARSLPESAS